MSTTTLRPDETVTYSAISGVGGDMHARLADSDDATYCRFSPNSYLRIGFPDPVLPAGAVPKQMTLSLRGSDDPIYTGGESLATELYLLGTGWENVITLYPAVDYVVLSSIALDTATVPDSLGSYAIEVVMSTPPWITFVDVMDVWVDFTYADQPTVAVSPVGTAGVVSDTSNPVVTWVHTPGADGGPQARYHVVIWRMVAGVPTDVTFDSGELFGSTTSMHVGPLVDATDYRAYVKTAQTVNGQPHYSEWSYAAFATDFDAPAIASVVATADDANARIAVAVTRVVAVPLWTSVTVERSADNGTTWDYVRGATAATAPAGNVFTVYDYEAGNDVDMLYRARSVAGEFASPLVESNLEAWVSVATWLKDPADSTANLIVVINSQDTLRHPRRQGVHRVIGRRAPVTTSDVRQLAEGPLVLVTITEAAADALYATLAASALLLQTPATDRFGSRYIAIGTTEELRPADNEREHARLWSIPFVEVDRPADPGS